MKKLFTLITITLLSNPAFADKISVDSLPQSIKHVDINQDNIITFEETRFIFEKYLLNDGKKTENNEQANEESTMIDLISFLEGCDFCNLKNTPASKHFIEMYFSKKYATKHDLSNEFDSIVVNAMEPESIFDKYFSVAAQIVSLHQRVLNPSKNAEDEGSGQPNTWGNESMVIFDLPISIKPWKNGYIDIMPEFTAGNALAGATGMGGFVNAIYGATTTKPILFRAQFSQILEAKNENALVKSVEFKIGRMNMLDLFDYNAFSGDPYADFLNYNHIMPAAWDYSGNAYGYVFGAGFKMSFKNSQINFATAAVNNTPAGIEMDKQIKEGHSFNLQYVKRFSLGEKSGTLRALGFYNRALSGVYSECSFDSLSGTAYFEDSLKSYQIKFGFALDADMALNDALGLFARYSWNNGKTEAMHYTEADASLNFGMKYNLHKFRRPNDDIGMAVSVNSLSNDHRTFIENGGTGFMLVNGISAYQKEYAFEVFYNINLFKYTTIGFNYQYIINPGYNKASASTSFVAMRLNFSFE